MKRKNVRFCISNLPCAIVVLYIFFLFLWLLWWFWVSHVSKNRFFFFFFLLLLLLLTYCLLWLLGANMQPPLYLSLRYPWMEGKKRNSCLPPTKIMGLGPFSYYYYHYLRYHHLYVLPCCTILPPFYVLSTSEKQEAQRTSLHSDN